MKHKFTMDMKATLIFLFSLAFAHTSFAQREIYYIDGIKVKDANLCGYQRESQFVRDDIDSS